jgi:hypothetical protein
VEKLSPDIRKLVEQMEREPEKKKFRVNQKDLIVDLQAGKRVGERKVLEHVQSKIEKDMSKMAAQKAFQKSRDHGYEYER